MTMNHATHFLIILLFTVKFRSVYHVTISLNWSSCIKNIHWLLMNYNVYSIINVLYKLKFSYMMAYKYPIPCIYIQIISNVFLFRSYPLYLYSDHIPCIYIQIVSLVFIFRSHPLYLYSDHIPCIYIQIVSLVFIFRSYPLYFYSDRIPCIYIQWNHIML